MILTTRRVGSGDASATGFTSGDEWRVPLRRVPGFTLIELLLVLVVLGVLAGGVVVSLAGRSQSFELETSAKDLALALEYAHQNARLHNRRYRVVFGNQGDEIRIETPGDSAGIGGAGGVRGGGGSLDAQWVPARGIPGKVHHLAGDVRVVGIGQSESMEVEGPFIVEFTSSGSASVGRVELANYQEQRIVIEIARATGQVRVSEVFDLRLRVQGDGYAATR